MADATRLTPSMNPQGSGSWFRVWGRRTRELIPGTFKAPRGGSFPSRRSARKYSTALDLQPASPPSSFNAVKGFRGLGGFGFRKFRGLGGLGFRKFRGFGSLGFGKFGDFGV